MQTTSTKSLTFREECALPRSVSAEVGVEEGQAEPRKRKQGDQGSREGAGVGPTATPERPSAQKLSACLLSASTKAWPL